MRNASRLAALFTLVVVGGLALAPGLTGPAHAGPSMDPKDPSFQLLPDCDAWIFPKDGGRACGFSKFEELVQRVIKYLLYLIMIIAFVILGWAGFKILTSAGNSESIQEAYRMIKITT